MSSAAKRKSYNLTEGGILNKLLLVAIPIIGTQIIQMTYNMADMFWLGRVGSNAVAATGVVGMYMWLSNAFMMFGRMGAEIGVAQNLGRGNREEAKKFGQAATTVAAVAGILYALVLVLGHRPLVGFFGVQEAEVIAAAEQYLIIIGLGIPFTFVTGSVTGSFNGSGNSRVPFVINGVGLVTNIILDPLLIFTFDLGVQGAAIATVTAQMLACVLSCLALTKYKNRPFEQVRLFVKPEKETLRQIMRWATPIAIESFLFTFLSMLVSRLVASYGAEAMAAQRIGSEMESLSWLIAGGFGSALTAYVGQNYGAGKWSRIHKGFSLSTAAMAVYGVFVTLFLFFGGRVIFGIFLPGETAVMEIGVNNLRILSICQILGCIEAVASGSFKGIGKTLPPSVTSATANALRVVAAYALTRTSLGLSGVWWAVSGGAIVRSTWLCAWYLISSRKFPKEDEQPALA